MQPKQRQTIIEIAAILRQAEVPLRVLGSIAWLPEVKQRFFDAGAKELPNVAYDAIDTSASLQLVQQARARIAGDCKIDQWLKRQADAIEASAKMLASIGTGAFHHYSAKLYGRPDQPLPDGLGTASELASRLDETLEFFSTTDLGAPPPACHLASGVAATLRQATIDFFGDAAPAIQIVDSLASNALAGPKRIRIRRDACFTDRDAAQLIQHEAYIHVATSLNGYKQNYLPILASSHGGTTKTQEGLAVFAEFISGVVDTDRLRRLSARVVAIQMAIDGADFLEVYRFYLDRIGSEDQAFENSRRVFRGGVLTGGAPFTKDIVYLDGFVRVHAYLTEVVASGRLDALHLLFCGKLALEDIPALAALAKAGLCHGPKFMPPWATDLRYLVAFLAYSDIFKRVNTNVVRSQQHDLLDQTAICNV